MLTPGCRVMHPPGSKGLDLDGLPFCEEATPFPAVLLARRHHANPRVQVLLVVPVKERLKVRPRCLEGGEGLRIGGMGLDRGKQRLDVGVVVRRPRPAPRGGAP